MTMPRYPSSTISHSFSAELRGAPMGFARSFLGRKAELTALQNAATERPLLMLWGPAGVGKTRVALEAASRLLSAGDFERAGFCALNAADSGEDIVAHVVRALDAPIRSRNVDAALAALTRWLTDRAVLIVFDNAEAMLDETLILARRLVAASPKTRVIITSRHAANEANEANESPQDVASVHIEPLPLDEAVALFRARAEHLDHVPPKMLEAIVERLDGLPLSIELAAGRIPTYSCAQLLKRLDNQLETLQDFNDRRGKWEATLLRCLDFSWPLLDEAERAALTQSSIFRGDFSLDAAESILSVPGTLTVDQVLHGLMRKSLLYPIARPEDGSQRFRLYEGVREYAARKLNTPEQSALTQRFVAYFAHRLAEHSRGFYSPAMPQHCEAMHAEFANARFALERANTAALPPAHAAQLARGLLQFVRIAAPYRDLRAPVSNILANLEHAEDPAALSEVRIVMAKLEASRTETHRALRYAASAAQLAEANTLVALFAEAKMLLGFLNIRFQRPDEAEAHLRKAEDALKNTGLHRLSGALHTNFGHLFLQRADPDQAHAHFRQALALHQRCDNPRFASSALFNLGAVECARGRFEQALCRFETALAQWSAWDDKHHRGVALICIGQCHLALGRRARARKALDAASVVFEGLDEPVLHAEMSSWLALTCAADDEPGLAAARSDEAIALCDLFQSNEHKTTYLAHRVLIEYALGQPKSAQAALKRAEELENTTADGPHRGALDVARTFAAHQRASNRPNPRRPPHTATLKINAMAHHEVTPLAAVAAHFLNGHFTHQTRVLKVSAPQADWFEWNGTRTDLSRRDAPRRILARLVLARTQQPGKPVSKDAIMEAGWPEAVLHPDSAASRIYTAIRQLRDDGLREVLLTRDGGYMLSPAVSITRVALRPGSTSTQSPKPARR